MSGDTAKRLVTWTVFVWAISIITFLIAGVYTMSGNAITTANETKERLGIVEERENNHYQEVIRLLEKIDNKLK